MCNVTPFSKSGLQQKIALYQEFIPTTEHLPENTLQVENLIQNSSSRGAARKGASPQPKTQVLRSQADAPQWSHTTPSAILISTK